jgi:hypothetical protein
VAKRVMALATRVECDKEGNGFGSKSNGNKGGGQATVIRAMAMVRAMTWAMATVTRVAGEQQQQGQ